jgi:hypothetical protein
MLKHKKSGIDYGYRKLANAIVLQAVEDYREAGNTIRGRRVKRKVEEFFHSPFFGLITDIDPDKLIDHLKELDHTPYYVPEIRKGVA